MSKSKVLEALAAENHHCHCGAWGAYGYGGFMLRGKLATWYCKEHKPDAAPPETLVRVVAPHFTAGLVMRDDRCVEAAPILAWAIGKTADELRDYFREKDWRATVCRSGDEKP